MATFLDAKVRLQSGYFFVRIDTTYGGTHKIQRNIIIEPDLGLPKKPKQEKYGPY